ncbi:MAG: NADPH-dependent FMN reductase [Saprospiraceae bacterium]
MKILTVSGSTRSTSSNAKLLEGIALLFSQHDFIFYKKLDQLPLFRAEDDAHPWAESVLDWRRELQNCDAVIISIPEYIYNLPALIKNALEWIATSGELVGKPILPITFTPNEPRGEKAMQSLCWSLQALDAQIVVQLPLFQNEIKFNENHSLAENGSMEILKEAVELLIGKS